MVPSVPSTALANRFPGKGSQVVSRADGAIGSNGTPGKAQGRASHPGGGRPRPRLHARNGPSSWHMIAVVDASAPGGINDICGLAEIGGGGGGGGGSKRAGLF